MVSGVENELPEISYSQKKKEQIHHALNQNEINIQGENMISLAATFDSVWQFTHREDATLYNIITDSLFEDNVKEIFSLFELKAIQLDKEFIDERPQNKSTMTILTPVKKTRLNKE